MSVIYRAKHRRTQGLETLLWLVERKLSKGQSAALGAAVGIIIGVVVFTAF